MEYLNNCCRYNDGNERCRDRKFLEDHRPYDKDQECDGTDENALPIDSRSALDQGHYLFACLDRLLAVLVSDAREVLDLTDKQGYCDARSKACRDRIRYIFQKASESAEAHYYEDDACHDGGNDEPFLAVFHNDTRNDRRKGCRRSCDLHAASAKEGYDESCNDRGIDTCFRTNTGSDCKSDG